MIVKGIIMIVKGNKTLAYLPFALAIATSSFAGLSGGPLENSTLARPACLLCADPDPVYHDDFTKYSAPCSLFGNWQEKWRRSYSNVVCANGSYSICTDTFIGGCGNPDTAPSCPSGNCIPGETY